MKVYAICPGCGWKNTTAQTTCDSCYKRLDYPEDAAPGGPPAIEARAGQSPPPPEGLSGVLAPYLVLVVILLLVAAGGFAYKGWHTLFDDSYRARIVGGDAYNYIIYAGRGTAYVCIGIVCALGAVTFSVFAVLDRLPRRGL